MIVTVVGAGAVGTFIGCRAVIGNGGSDGLEVRLVGRDSLLNATSGASDLITALTLNSTKRERSESIAPRERSESVAPYEPDVVAVDGKPMSVGKSLQAAVDADVIVVTLKTQATEDVARELATLLAAKKNSSGQQQRKTIISLQNGIAAGRMLSKHLGEGNDIVAGIVEFNVTWNEGAVFVQQTSGGILLSDAGTGSHVKEFQRLLTRGGIKLIIKSPSDVSAYQYGKLCVNLINSVNALSGRPIKIMMSNPQYRAVLAASMREALAIFSKMGIPVKSNTMPLSVFPFLLTSHPCLFCLVQLFLVKIKADAKTSMLQDLEKYRSTEVDFLNGEIINMAAENGMPEPSVNATLLRLVKEAEARGEGPPCISGEDLAELCNI